ncbi:glycosyltransferase family 4 protein [Methylobacterium aerolatum]|uniref:Glycosyltransferase involved in cell wall biosynthesis n=1 Tax=Methylobacterium aerolatum TaxID=418708 RepID=A0ABU0HUL0_9HYPH|nr:glycosyltransferase family 4 protein [Methylobacterium aerolatum]MDQ0446016.1 glycosyltransferase involved in cell wall biosynthesis [Methylobacterium aerolatum]GJD35053.1 D-inositol-3-phosphate glycosyltransferase [Methylobacterium aerolatum]
MTDVCLCVPGDLATPTGGYAYARHLLAHLPRAGVSAVPLTLPSSFPHPSPDDLAETAARLSATPSGAILLIDGLAYGALPPSVIAASGPRPVVALVHHPLGLEAGLSRAEAEGLLARERAALCLAARVVTTSRFTRDLLVAEFAVPGDRITIAEPGTEPARRAAGGDGRPVRLLTVGALTPRKGVDHLVAALGRLPDLDWTLTVAGALDRAPGHVAGLRRQIAEAGLEARITLAAAVPADRLDAFYDGADLAVSPSLFEGYGMALAEALARGLPVVSTTGGAAADTVPEAAGLKVAPGDVPALAEALRTLIADPARRSVAAQAAWEAGRHLPRWEETARRVAACLREARP